jgi:hypothetical protein
MVESNRDDGSNDRPSPIAACATKRKPHNIIKPDDQNLSYFKRLTEKEVE